MTNLSCSEQAHDASELKVLKKTALINAFDAIKLRHNPWGRQIFWLAVLAFCLSMLLPLILDVDFISIAAPFFLIEWLFIVYTAGQIRKSYKQEYQKALDDSYFKKNGAAIDPSTNIGMVGSLIAPAVCKVRDDAQRRRLNSQSGFTVVELVVAAVVILIIFVYLAQLVATRATVGESSIQQKQAFSGLSSAIDVLSTNRVLLQNTHSFDRVGQSAISITEKCNTLNCDYYVVPASTVEAENKSLAGGVKWRKDFTASPDAAAVFLRRINIEDTFSPTLKLKKITVAVVSSSASTETLALEEKVIEY